MKEENSPEFQFNGDDQDPDELYQEEMKDLRVEKLNQRITLFSILLPCLLVIILYFGYRDLKKVGEAVGEHIDTIVVPKTDGPGDIHFVSRMLAGIEMFKGLPNRIGIEAIIESASASMESS